MKTLIAVSSRTGNTLKIAQAIHAVLPDATLARVENIPDPVAFDLIYLGFWVDKGSADEQARAFMRKIRNQKIALFATLGAYPDSPHARESLDKAVALLPESHVADRFICQGAIDPQLIEWMKQLPGDHPHAPNAARVKRWKDAAAHPDETDCRAAATWALDLYNRLHTEPA